MGRRSHARHKSASAGRLFRLLAACLMLGTTNIPAKAQVFVLLSKLTPALTRYLPGAQIEESEDEAIPPTTASVPDSRSSVQSDGILFLPPKADLWFKDDLGSGFFRPSRDPLERKRAEALRARFTGTKRLDEFWFGRGPDKTVEFISFSTTDQDHYLSLGIKHATRGPLEREGLRFMATLGVKLADYDPMLDTRAWRPHAARALVGKEWQRGSLTFSLLGGASYLFHPLGTIRATNRLGRFGASFMVDFWWNWAGEPLPGLRATSGYLLFDNAQRSISARLRPIFGYGSHNLRFGPEFAFSTGQRLAFKGYHVQGSWKKLRLGLHVSEIPSGWAFLGIAAGIEARHRQKPGYYLEVTSYLRY